MSDSPHPSASVLVGQTLRGKYRVDRVLGSGGMGTVVAATNLRLGLPVAIKVLRPALLGNASAVARFAREARAAAKLTSEHTVRILDVDDSDAGEPFLVMELLLGHDLATAIAGGPLPVARAVTYVLQACVAVAEAHAHGIVHRDIKPANLFLTTDPSGEPRVKLLDFGISKALENEMEGDLSLTDAGGVLGSPYFMSPEQIRSAKQVDARTDLWSLGVVLYQLLTGALPFAATNATSLAARIAADPPLPIGRVDVPTALRAVILRCLEKSPDRRFATVLDLARALAPFGGAGGAEWVLRAERAAQTQLNAQLASTAPSEPPRADAASARDRRTESLEQPPPPLGTEYGSVGASSPAPARATPGRRWLLLASTALALAGLWWIGRSRETPPSNFPHAAPNAPTLAAAPPPSAESPAASPPTSSAGRAPSAGFDLAPVEGGRLRLDASQRRPQSPTAVTPPVAASSAHAPKDPLQIDLK